jgi:hypothetical protein
MTGKKKWFLRIVLGIVILVALLLLAVQVVLWTDLPRGWVLSVIQEKLQLRVAAQNFSTGWGGDTTLTGVSASLPLAEESFLQAPRLEVKHTPLLELMIGRPLRVKAIVIDRPSLLVLQQADGRWNVQEVAELIRRATGGKTPETQSQPHPGGVPQLPDVTITDAVIRLIDVRGRQATFSPLEVKGRAQGPLVWKYDASIDKHLVVDGEIAPGGNWQHSAHLRIDDLEAWVRPFLASSSPSTLEALKQFHLDGDWRGRIDGDLKGRLDLKRLFVAGYTATGPLGVAFNSGTSATTVITPAGATITPPHREQIPPARVNGGSVTLDGQRVTASDLSLAFAGGEVRMGGNYQWSSGTAALKATWNQLALPKGAVHGGALTASLRQPWPGQPVIDATLESEGRRGDDRWNTQLTLTGAGSAWDQITWRLKAPALSYWAGGKGVLLDGLQANFSTRGDLVTLDSLSLPSGDLYGQWERGTLAAKGRYDLTSGNWNVYLTGNDWSLSPDRHVPADFLVNAYGDRTWARLEQFYLEGAGLIFWAYGDVSYTAPGMPAELHLYSWYPPVDYTWHERGGARREDVRLAGRLHSRLHLTGAAWPIGLDIDGALFARQFRVKDHPVGDVAIKLTGRAGPERLSIGTSRLELFSGIWGLDADYRYADRLTSMKVRLQELSLAELDNFVGPPPNIRGTVSGQWDVELPAFDLRRMTVTGDYSAHHVGKLNPAPPTTSPAVAAALDKPQSATRPADVATVRAAAATSPTIAAATRSVTTPREVVTLPAPRPTTAPTTTTVAATAPTTRPAITPIAREITGKVSVASGVVTLDPIVMKLGQGQTRATVSFPIDAPRMMHVAATTAAWPLEFTRGRRGEPRNVLLWGGTGGLDVDLQRLTFDGPLNVHAVISSDGRTVADFTIDAALRGKRVDLKSIKGEGLGGTIAGDGYLYLDNPLQSRGRVDWSNVDAQSVVALVPFLDGLAGRYTGTVHFAPTDPATDPHATGPFEIGGTVHSADGNWNGLSIGDASFLAHADVNRAVLDRLNWRLAGGSLRGWTRVTWYDHDPFVHVNLSFDDLDLDQVVRAVQPRGKEHKPTPGLLTGTAIAAGNPFSDRGRKEASGDFHARLTKSDLVNIPTVNLLYSVLSVKLGPQAPAGHGFVDARLEGERLEIPAVRYFDRGVDLWAAVSVINVFRGAASPITGTAAGSARPLKDLKLPFMADVDQILGALQGAVATASIEGTLGDPAPRIIPFAEAGEAFRRFMVGEVKNEVRGTAGR